MIQSPCCPGVQNSSPLSPTPGRQSGFYCRVGRRSLELKVIKSLNSSLPRVQAEPSLPPLLWLLRLRAFLPFLVGILSVFPFAGSIRIPVWAQLATLHPCKISCFTSCLCLTNRAETGAIFQPAWKDSRGCQRRPMEETEAASTAFGKTREPVTVLIVESWKTKASVY